MSAIQQQGHDLVEKFKAEYDFVANAYKYIDALYLDLYKNIRELPEPNETLPDVYSSMSKASDILKRIHYMVTSAGPGGSTAAPGNLYNNFYGTMYTQEQVDKQIATVKEEYETKMTQMVTKNSQDIAALEEKHQQGIS